MLRSLVVLFVLSVRGSAAAAPPEPAATDVDVVVIGAGMGGLSAATHLALGGLEVLVLEQHHKVGGCTSSFSRGDYNFDVALHEMTGGGSHGPLADLLRETGVADKVELIRIPDLYRAVGPGLDFTMPADLEAAEAALIAKWPEERRGIERFHRLMRRVAADTDELDELYLHPNKVALAPFGQPTLTRLFRSNLGAVLDRHFDDPALKAAVSQFWVYYGPPPSELWTIIFMAANHSYLDQGAWHIRGSSQALSDAYAERIEELGGAVRTGTRVARILVEDDAVRGVVTEAGDTITSRYVVSNADPFQTWYGLVGEELVPRRVDRRLQRMEPSNSLFGVYLGLDVETSFFGTEDHEIFYSRSLDPDVNYRAMMEGRYAEGAVSITIYSNLPDPWYAPEGGSAVVLHAYADWDGWPDDREAYQQRKDQAASDLVALAEEVLPGLREHTVVQEVVTPHAIHAFTLQHRGTPYGWRFTPRQGLRLPNHTSIGGLYLAGSWTNPGHGVTTAQLSGHQAARLILVEEDKR